MKQTIRTTCSYCSVGCNFDAVFEDGELKSFLPDKEYPVNLGKSCPKGFHMLKAFEAEDRATVPKLRNESGKLVPVSWSEALGEMTERFKAIKAEHGPESVAFLSTGQIPFEEMAYLGALFKFGMGFVHADGNTRQCMATAAVAYKQAFGFDAPPFSYKDFEESDYMMFVGANPVIAHPIMWNRVKMNKQDAKIVVVDPRRTKTAQQAHRHVALRPKSDLILLYALIRELIAHDRIDREFVDAHTDGFDELEQHVAPFTLERAAAETGIAAEEIAEIAREIHEARAASVWWTMGVNQGHQAVRTAQAIINLCLITGNIGRPGTGPNSITGQANAMGSRLYSNTTGMFALYDFENADHRRQMAEILGIPEDRIPAKNSLPYQRIIEEIDRGSIRGLWIIATNPVHSWVNKEDAVAALRKLDFLVVQDLYETTDTAQVADLLLPAAGSGEKEGTFINSERRLGTVQKVTDPPGEALPDFEIFRRLRDTWGCDDVLGEWESPEAVFRILQRTSRGRPCDITGIDGYRMLRERGGVQWPYPEKDPDDAPERRLFEDGRFFTPNGRARLLTDPVQAPPELPDEEYPFVLLTGRGTVVQFHTQTRTGKVDMLKRLYPAELHAQINPADAERLGIEGGEWVTVTSRRGSAQALAEVTEEVPPGQVFLPMHYYDTNKLTYPVFDPY
ncbi:MAG: molybdopterin oxidoreductase family protein, partial [Spirochaetaceae bacterium]